MQPTCLMAVTVMTKNSGSPLVTGLVGVSMINWRDRHTQRYKKDTWMEMQFFAVNFVSYTALFSL